MLEGYIVTDDKVRFTSREQEMTDMFRPCDRSDGQAADQRTEHEKRVAFLQDLVDCYGYEMPAEVFNYIIEHYDMLNLRCAYTNMRIVNVKDLETAKSVLKKTILSGHRDLISPEMILQGVSEYYQIDPECIKGRIRNVEYMRPREIFMYLCREMTDLTLKDIAFLLNKEYCYNPFEMYMKICAEVDKDEELKGQIGAITDRIMTLYSEGMV